MSSQGPKPKQWWAGSRKPEPLEPLDLTMDFDAFRVRCVRNAWADIARRSWPYTRATTEPDYYSDALAQLAFEGDLHARQADFLLDAQRIELFRRARYSQFRTPFLDRLKARALALRMGA